MLLTLPEYRAGQPLGHKALVVFPLFTDFVGEVDYMLAEDAIAAGTLVVSEVSDAGVVSQLLVRNQGDRRVLFIEGEELVGAKQNRIVNTSILVAAGSQLVIPVSCVEQGRWEYKGRKQFKTGCYAPVKLRRALKSSVGAQTLRRRGHTSDQHTLWNVVLQQQRSLGVASVSAALADTFRANDETVADYRTRLPYINGARGLAIALEGQVVSADFFDTSETCFRFWDRIVSGAILDALGMKCASNPDMRGVDSILFHLRHATWQPIATIGDGQEYRIGLGTGQASVLLIDGTLVHGSIVAIT